MMKVADARMMLMAKYLTHSSTIYDSQTGPVLSTDDDDKSHCGTLMMTTILAPGTLSIRNETPFSYTSMSKYHIYNTDDDNYYYYCLD